MICVIASLAAAPVGMLAGNDAIKSMAVREVRQNGSRVTGLVTDTKGEPLPGVSIYVKSMKGGCLTDVNGRFSLPVPKDGTYDLEVSLVGMRTVSKRVSVRGVANIPTIQLSEDVSELSEVVVTGYGNIRKGAYTGSASVMSVDKQKDLPVISLSQMMEGNLSGMSITTNSGTPGASSSIRIRGIGSLSASNEPLYVLDGVPVMSGDLSANGMNTSGLGILSTLNPADIENVTILKDAASASLYGARGANGVVLITTKKGAQGKTSYTLKASFGISDLAYDFRPTMGGDERRQLILEGLTNANIDAGETVEWA